jgi:hypothetical protein
MNKLKHIVDASAFLIAGAAIFKFLPFIATSLSIVWYCLRFYTFFKNKKDIGE